MLDSRTIRGIVVAVAVIAVATALRMAVTPLIGPESVPFITFYPAIALAALFGGVVPGVIAIGLAAAIANYAWVPPVGDFLPASLEEYVILGLFMASAAVIVALCERHRRARVRARADADRLLASEGAAREQSTAMTRLQTLGTLCAQKDSDLDFCLREIVHTAIALTRADKGNLQVLDEHGDSLRIVAHHGFDDAFLRFFARVDADDPTAGGLAMRSGARAIVEDVAHSAVYAGQASREAVLAAGVRAVQATPLVSSAGTLIGLVSTHFASPRRPTAQEVGWMDLLARQAADFLERKQMEAALRRTNTALRDTDRRKNEFIAMLGHELRNPLGAISGAVGVLNLVGTADESARRARTIIDRQVRHLARLVDDLLDVSRLSTGKLVLSRQPLDLAESVRSTLGLLQSTHRLDRHAVTADLSTAWVRADEARMAQVLTNLMDNAVKYTPPGGTIGVRVRAEGGDAVLEVADSGIGIEPESIEQLFDLFAQGTAGPGGVQGGLGIGLTLVKKLAELHGGIVHVKSDGPGKGATVTVRLSAIDAPELPRPEAPFRPVERQRGRRVVIVEDNEDVREMLRMTLTLTGHEVYEAEDGPSGIAALQMHRPDVALIDLNLPGVDGLEVARKAREVLGRTVRLVAVTGYGRAEDRTRALQAGFDEHIVKPIDPEILVRLVSRGSASPQSLGAMAHREDPIEVAVVQCREARRIRAEALAACLTTRRLTRRVPPR